MTNYTVKDAVIFQPNSTTDLTEMHVLVKNNLTVIDKIIVNGKGEERAFNVRDVRLRSYYLPYGSISWSETVLMLFADKTTQFYRGFNHTQKPVMEPNFRN